MSRSPRQPSSAALRYSEGLSLSAQTPPPRSTQIRIFLLVPTWNTELRELAPNVYAYIQAGGPGRDNVSVSNAGMFVGDSGTMVVDALAAPMHTRAFVAAIRKTTDKPFPSSDQHASPQRSRQRQSVHHRAPKSSVIPTAAMKW